MDKNKLITSLIIGSTTLLGAIAIFTAYKLYQLRQGPGNPEPSQAQVIPSPTPAIETSCNPLTFSIKSQTTSLAQASPTASPTLRPTATPTASPTIKPTVKPSATPTASPSLGGLAQASPTPTATPTVKPSVTPAPTAVALPEAGVSFPTLIGLAAGAFLVMGALLLLI